MIARITTTMPGTTAELWEKIIEPASLQYVSAPLLQFKPLGENVMPKQWQPQKTLDLKLYFLNFIPLGRHQITLVEIDKDANRIVSNESGTMSPLWNHTISFSQTDENILRYTDEIEIKAGIRTVFIWLFAHWFYRHRQRRWKKLLA